MRLACPPSHPLSVQCLMTTRAQSFSCIKKPCNAKAADGALCTPWVQLILERLIMRSVWYGCCVLLWHTSILEKKSLAGLGKQVSDKLSGCEKAGDCHRKRNELLIKNPTPRWKKATSRFLWKLLASLDVRTPINKTVAKLLLLWHGYQNKALEISLYAAASAGRFNLPVGVRQMCG